MIRKIRNISKQSGVWVTRWNRIQIKFLLYFLFAIIAAGSFFYLISWVSQSWSKERNTEIWDSQKALSKTTAEHLASSLEGMNDHEAVETIHDWDDQNSASIVLINSEGQLLYSELFDLTLFNDGLPGISMPYLNIPVELASGTGFLIYQNIISGGSLSINTDLLYGSLSVLFFCSYSTS